VRKESMSGNEEVKNLDMDLTETRTGREIVNNVNISQQIVSNSKFENRKLSTEKPVDKKSTQQDLLDF